MIGIFHGAIEKILKCPPDVALVDVDMPGLSGTGAIRILRKSLPHLGIIVLSTYHNDEYIRETMDAGADCYVLKNVAMDELAAIIKSYTQNTPLDSPYLIERRDNPRLE